MWTFSIHLWVTNPEVGIWKSPALIALGSISRYTNCSRSGRIDGGDALSTFLKDWARQLGKPRRILHDTCGTGFRNQLRTEAIDTSGWKIIMAPPGTQSQNGLAERAVLSLKVAVRNALSAESRPVAGQRVSTLSVISKNHAPNTINGAPTIVGNARAMRYPFRICARGLQSQSGFGKPGGSANERG